MKHNSFFAISFQMITFLSMESFASLRFLKKSETATNTFNNVFGYHISLSVIQNDSSNHTSSLIKLMPNSLTSVLNSLNSFTDLLRSFLQFPVEEIALFQLKRNNIS